MKISILAVVFLIIAAAPLKAALRIEKMKSASAQGKTMEVAAGQVLVRFSPGTTIAQSFATLQGMGCRIIKNLPRINWSLVALPQGMLVASGIALLRNAPGIAAVTPDHIYRPTKTPNDPLVSSQYALSQVDAFGAWEYDTGSSTRVTIAMIDTGIDSTQPDLSAKLATTSASNLSQFFDPDNSGTQATDTPPTPACDHATRTSGVAAASTDNGIGIAGMSWGAQLLSLKIFNNNDCNSDCSDASCINGNPPGCCATDDVAITNALNYATSLQGSAATGRLVINMSIGASGTPCISSDGTAPASAVADAIALATSSGIPVAISAGNDGGEVNAPANCAGTTPSNGIIPVGATDQNNNIAYFSSNGPELAANGVAAPGVNVETTDLGDTYTGSASGTSFSAPHVAGLAALLISAQPNATPAQVQTWILAGADNIGASANFQGAGRINAYKSLHLAETGVLTSTAAAVGFDAQQSAFAFPNPFRISQDPTVSFTIPPNLQGSNPTIKIFTVTGQLVRELSGLSWDGRNASGNTVASGTYIFEVTTGQGKSIGRMAVIR